MADHSIRVVMLVTPDEYLAMKSMADSDGLSDSAFMRMLLKLEARKRAMEQVLKNEAFLASEEAAQFLRRAA